MPKLKTHKGTAKRIRITPTGKVKRLKSGDVHNKNKKDENRKRATRTGAIVKGKIARNIKRALGV